MKKLTLILGLVFCPYSWAGIELIDVSVLKKRIENPEHSFILLDVRTVSEYQSGHI